MINEFHTFIIRGNMIDLAVGIVTGAAFTTVVNSLVSDLLVPRIGLLLGHVDFSNLFVTLGSGSYPTLAVAKVAGAPTPNYGLFLHSIINLIIVGFAVFMVVKQVNRFRGPEPAAPVTTKDCPTCAMAIPLAARRCPHCASELR